jgi:hypothetical protein
MAAEMKKWIRFRHAGATGFGVLTPNGISAHDGEMFGRNAPNGKTLEHFPPWWNRKGFPCRGKS